MLRPSGSAPAAAAGCAVAPFSKPVTDCACNADSDIAIMRINKADLFMLFVMLFDARGQFEKQSKSQDVGPGKKPASNHRLLVASS